MNKYIITDKVNTQLIPAEDILWAGAELVRVAPMAGGVAVVAAVAVFAREHFDKSITRITTVDQLRQYKNCISNEWKKNVLYVEHPHRQNVLIEATLYKDYILREMVADLANYISDRLDLKKLVIGLVVSGKGNAKAKIPVNQLNAEAAIKCSLDKNYTYSVRDTHANPDAVEDCVWINQFPDIISAVQHGAGSMEVCKKVAIDLDVTAGIGKAVNGVLNAKNNYEFYITYEKSK